MIVVTKHNIDQSVIDGLEELVLKYSPIHKVLGIHKEVDSLLKNMLKYTDKYMPYTYVDYKVRYHKVGETSCPVAGWHYDVVKDFDHPSPHEIHVIWSSRDGTEFLNKDGAVYSPPEQSIVVYGRELHRGSTITQEGKRLIIRVTQTNRRIK